jgi:hypothetical protein
MSSPVLKGVVSWRGSRGSGALGGGTYRAYEEASARVQDSSAEAPGSPSWGDWRTKSHSTSRPVATPLGNAAFRSRPGTAAPGPPGLPSGNGIVQELDLHCVEDPAAPFVPLGVDPHPEAVFTL